MKKIFILFLLVLTAIQLSYADDLIISIPKEEYYRHETFQAEVFVNLSIAEKITPSNFALTDKNSNIIPVAVFLEEISENHYFVYFDIPELKNDTYYFLVRNVKYNDIVLKKISKSKEFHLNDIKSISIYPAIFNKLNSTILKITNYGNLTNITLSSKEINLTENYALKDSLSVNIDIPKNIDNFYIRLDYLDRNYLIPVIPYKEFAKPAINETKEISPLIKPQKDSILLLNSSFGTYFNKRFLLEKDSSLQGPFYLKNAWHLPLYNLTFILTDDLDEVVRLRLDSLEKIEKDETVSQYIWLNENKNPSKSKYFGSIEVASENNLLASLPLEINFIDEEERKENLTIKGALKPVNDSKENIKNETKKEFKEEKQDKNLIILFALIIFFIIALLLYFIFKKPKEKGDYKKFLKI